MKVLMIGPGRSDKGGIATVVNQYYEANIDKKVELKYITTMHDGGKGKKLITAIGALMEFLVLVNSCEIIHIHMSSRASFYRKKVFVEIAKKRKKKVIIHVHGSEFDVFYNRECNSKEQEKIRNTFAMADRVIVLSAEWKNFFETICEKKKIYILHNAVVIPEYEKKSLNNHNILFLGRLGERKGIYDLLEAMPEVIKKISDVHLYYGGDGEIEKTQEYIEKLKIKNNCTYLGWIDGNEKNKMLKKCSVFVLPSYHEGMPMAILEAMSYGAIVVSTYTGGIPQVIEDGKNGYLFNAGDINGLQECLFEALENNKKSEISLCSYQTVEENFNVEKNVDILCEWYKEIVYTS